MNTSLRIDEVLRVVYCLVLVGIADSTTSAHWSEWMIQTALATLLMIVISLTASLLFTSSMLPVGGDVEVSTIGFSAIQFHFIGIDPAMTKQICRFTMFQFYYFDQALHCLH